jgi:cobalt transporter subunit CbtB
MSDITATQELEAPAVAPVAIDDLLPYALFAALIGVLALYFVGAEEGATSLVRGMAVHEWVHDARHLLGFPCH